MKDLAKRFDFIDRIEDNSTPDLVVKEMQEMAKGIGSNIDLSMARMRVYFKNGREMSIIRGQCSYGGRQGLYEIMIYGKEGDEDLYDKGDNAHIVLGHLSKERVEYYVHKIGVMP